MTHNAQDMADKLSEFNSAWTKTREEYPRRSAHTPIPNNRYHATLHQFYLDETFKGNPKIVWDFRIEGGDYDNRHIFYSRVINDNPENIRVIQEMLHKCGIDIVDLRELVALMPLAVGLRFEIKLDSYMRDGRENRIVYINKRLDQENENIIADFVTDDDFPV